MRKLLLILMLAGVACLLYGLAPIGGGISLLRVEPVNEALGRELIRHGLPWAISGGLLAVCAGILRRNC